jgi:hypothetical protein
MPAANAIAPGKEHPRQTDCRPTLLAAPTLKL